MRRRKALSEQDAARVQDLHASDPDGRGAPERLSEQYGVSLRVIKKYLDTSGHKEL